MPRLCVGATGGKFTKGYVFIHNATICTFQRKEITSVQMEKWEELWPAELAAESETRVKIKFRTRRSIPFHLDAGKVTYEAFDNAGLSLGHFHISVDASASTVHCCCFWTFKAELSVDWASMPKIFGLAVEPRVADRLPFRKLTTTHLHITGDVLLGGPRDIHSQPRISEFANWDEAAAECKVGDVVAVDRGMFRHMGVVHDIMEDGRVRVSHLSGTAGEVISTHGFGGGVREVWQALSGSHGNIAGVQLVGLEEFSGGDPCRVENLHDDEWKAYTVDVLRRRMGQAEGARDYSLFEFNCEHYANLIRYGMPHSDQLEAMKRKFDLAQHGRQFRDDMKSNIQNMENRWKDGKGQKIKAYFNRHGNGLQKQDTPV